METEDISIAARVTFFISTDIAFVLVVYGGVSPIVSPDVANTGGIFFLLLMKGIDENYRVITLILKNMVIYPSVWIIMHYSRYPRFLQLFYIHIH